MVARLYSWDDAGAPLLSTANDGSLLTILKNCLVDGYGTRTPAGWTMPYIDVGLRKGVFKPGLGNEVYLWLNDNISYNCAEVRGYGAMTDIDTGTEEFPRDLDLASLSYTLYAPKRLKNTSGYERWFVVASEEWFYFWSPDFVGSYPSGFFFGKMNMVDSAYPNPYLLTGYSSTVPLTTSGYQYSFPLYSTSGDWWLKSNYFNTGFPEELKLISVPSTYSNPNPITGSLDVAIEWLADSTSKIYYGNQPNRFKALGSAVYIFLQNKKIVLNGKKFITSKYGGYLFIYEYDVDVG